MEYDFVVKNLSSEEKEIVLFLSDPMPEIDKKPTKPSPELSIACSQMPYDEFRELWGKNGFVTNLTIFYIGRAALSPLCDWAVKSWDMTGINTISLKQPKNFCADSFTCVFFTVKGNTEVKISFDHEPAETDTRDDQ